MKDESTSIDSKLITQGSVIYEMLIYQNTDIFSRSEIKKKTLFEKTELTHLF